jgi:hypothetical protein
MLVMTGAFAVRSAAGFGAVLVAVPLLAFILPVPIAVAVASAMTALTSVHQVGREWRRVAWREFTVMSLYSVAGIGLGFYFLGRLDEHALQRALGIFLVLYSIYALATAKSPPVLPARWHGALAALTGISGGVCGALFGGGVGPIYVIYFNAVRLEREVFRVTMTTVVLTGGIFRIGGYASLGLYERANLMLIALGLPLVFVGSWLGDRVVRYLDARTFTWLIGGLILFSGAALALK